MHFSQFPSDKENEWYFPASVGICDERKRETMEKAVSIQAMFTDLPFYERFGKARRAGFSLVEFGDWTKLDLSRVTEELAAHALGLWAITGADTFSLTDPDTRGGFLEYLSQSIAVAKSFGCRNLIIQSADKDDDTAEFNTEPTESADFTSRAAATRTLMEAAQKAERAGVTLFLKPAPMLAGSLSYLHTNSSAGSVVKVINSPALRLLFDISLMRKMEDDIVSTFRRYKDYIRYVHIGDANDSLPADCGEANLRLIKTALEKDLAYDGAVGFVFNAGRNEQLCLNEIAAVF